MRAIEATEPDTASWEHIARTHAPSIYRIAYRLTGNRPDAEDLTHDALIRAFRYLASYTPGRGSFEGWLYRITVNLYLDQVRRTRRIRIEPAPVDAERLAPGTPGPAEVLDDRTLDDDVRAALDALQPDFRAAVVLCDIEGLSNQQGAGLLGIKVTTMGTRLHRGRTQLRAALAHRAAPA